MHKNILFSVFSSNKCYPKDNSLAVSHIFIIFAIIFRIYNNSKVLTLNISRHFIAKGTPSLTLSLAPVFFMLLSLIGIIIFAGGSAISDYSHIVLLVSAIVAVALSAFSRTLSPERLMNGLKRSSAQILPAVPLLLLIALISTTWLLSGVVPTLVDYGIKLLNPTFFLVTTCAVCALVSVLTGSSWTTIATIGVAFIGIGKFMGYGEGWIAGDHFRRVFRR